MLGLARANNQRMEDNMVFVAIALYLFGVVGTKTLLDYENSSNWWTVAAFAWPVTVPGVGFLTFIVKLG